MHKRRRLGSTRSGLPPLAKEKHWYGWQTLTTYGVALAAMPAAAALGADRGGGVVVLIGAASYTFSAPIVHAAHGRWLPALGSLGLRVVPSVLAGRAMTCWQPLDSSQS